MKGRKGKEREGGSKGKEEAKESKKNISISLLGRDAGQFLRQLSLLIKSESSNKVF